MMFTEARAASLTLLGDEGIHGEDGCLRRENFLREDAVNFGIAVEAGVLEHDAAEIQVGSAPQRGESDAAGGDSEEHQILNAARAQNQVQLVLRKCADSLLINNEIFGASDGAVKFGGWRANYEEIVFLQLLPARFRLWKFRMAGGKSQSYVDDLKLFFPRKFHGLGRVGDDGISSGDESKNAFLEIKSKQCCLFGSSFMCLPFWFFR